MQGNGGALDHPFEMGADGRAGAVRIWICARKILKNKISHDGVVIPDDVFNFIAKQRDGECPRLWKVSSASLAGLIDGVSIIVMIDLPLTKQCGEPSGS